MSYRLLEEAVADLPWSLRDQVLGYAKSVEASMPSIFHDAQRKLDAAIADQVVFLAGVRKLHGIVASSFWALDNSGALLKKLKVTSVRAGAADLSRDGPLFKAVKSTLQGIEKVLEEQGVREYIDLDYSELVTQLAANGRRRP
jgi:hypothetical protein